VYFALGGCAFARLYLADVSHINNVYSTMFIEYRRLLEYDPVYYDGKERRFGATWRS
jgi:hypothetical protein